jgi:hypothetical protein
MAGKRPRNKGSRKRLGVRIITAEEGGRNVEKQATPEEIITLLEGIAELGWFSEKLYSAWHIPCGQCYTYFISVSNQGRGKTVQAVDGGTDAPTHYWRVVSLLNGIIPPIEPAE